MAKRILVPVDGSPQSDDALAFAADEWSDATLVLVHVIDPVEAGYSAGRVPSTGEEWYEQATQRAEDLFEEARTGVDAAVEMETRTEVGRPSGTIVDVADEEDVDLVVIGSHGRQGISRIILGSVAEHVVRESSVPVVVVR